MPGLFARVKNWISNENLTDEDLNAEFNNLLNNLEPEGIDGYSTDVPQKQETSDPGELGTESLGGSLAVEIEELRFMIAQITGEDEWYIRPERSLKAGGGDIAFYLPFDGADADDAAKSTLQRGVIPLPAGNAGAGSSTNISSNVFSSTLPKFGKFSWVAGQTSPFSQWTILAVPGTPDTGGRGTISLHFYGLAPASHLAYNPLLGIELMLDNTGKLRSVITKQTTTSETAKATTTLQGVTTLSGASAWQHALLKYAANSYNGSGTDTFEQRASSAAGVELDNQISSVASVIAGGNGGVWFFGCKAQELAWDHYSAMKVLPSAETSSAWTFTGSTDAVTILSDGLLRIKTDSSGASQGFYSKTGLIVQAASGFVFEIKMRINSYAFFSAINPGAVNKPPFGIKVCDSASDTSFLVGFHRAGFYLLDNLNAPAQVVEFNIDTTSFHRYRFVQISSTLHTYVDGVYLGSVALTADAVTSGVISFGGHELDITTVDAEVEYVAFKASAGTNLDNLAPVKQADTGKLSDITLLRSTLDDAALESKLSTTKPSAALGRDKAVYPFWKALPLELSSGASNVTFTDTQTNITSIGVQSDGRTPVQITFEGDVGGDTEGMAITLLIVSTDGLSDIPLAQHILARFPARTIVLGDAGEREPFSLSWKTVLPLGNTFVYLRGVTGNSGHTGTVISNTLKSRISYDRQE